MNDYGGTQVPPGWDDWRVFLQTVYYNYDLNENGAIVHYGNTAADYSTTVLANTIFSTVPGAPVFVGKATRYRSKHPALGHDLDMTGHNALQSTFVFDA